MRKEFNSNIGKIFIGFILLFTILIGCLYFITYKSNKVDMRNNVVKLNEIEQLTLELNKDSDESEKQQLYTAIGELQSDLLKESQKEDNSNTRTLMIGIYLVVILFVLGVFLYIYSKVIKPFERLNEFAGEVAKGNMDLPLEFERNNMFGAFTWAFDSMRREIKKARTCEKEAIENNKTVIATISHDIKTPIASIRAYSEALLAGMDHNLERRQRYISTIMDKCDEVSQLTNDLFLHALADLDKLKMNLEKWDARSSIEDILHGIQGDNPRIEILSDISKVNIYVDMKRLEQVYENLIGNALKYAGNSQVVISHEENEEYLIGIIRDYGDGIDDEDIPFIFDKFYRGKNVGNKEGAGLGLYIVKYIMEQMNGKIEITNTNPGVEAKLYIPK